MAKRRKKPKQVEALKHDEAKRTNIPTAEYQAVLNDEEKVPIQIAYSRRNPDLDPQFIWRGKDLMDWSDLVVPAPPLFIQEKIHPKVLIDDLRRQTEQAESQATGHQVDLFADFNGMPEGNAKTEFYQHDANWTNRMILGDSLQVMASLAEREGLRGKVQCIYFDPPYGIKFNSNFQWSTTSRDVRDGKTDHITREPEQVKAFRDTWRDGIHSYMTYLRDRLTVARDLLAESGSIFVQIGDENVHRVRAVLDEVFGENNLISMIAVQKTSSFPSENIANVCDYLCWYAKKHDQLKSRQLFEKQTFELGTGNARWLELPDFSYRGVTSRERRREDPVPEGVSPYKPGDLTSQGRASTSQPFSYGRVVVDPTQKNAHWKANYPIGMNRLARAGRIHVAARSLQYKRYHRDWPYMSRGNMWTDTGTGNYTDDKVYIVQTPTKLVERCLLMATDPGDLVLDPTCGSGTIAYVAEQWGRRWIAVDTSRVALALARARIMGARYPFYLLADSPEGQRKVAEVAGSEPSTAATSGNIRQGFVYERVPHVMLKTIANNTEIDVIWEKLQLKMEPLRQRLNELLGEAWGEWEIPREVGSEWPGEAQEIHAQWWKERIARQREIDVSIASQADSEYLYDKPYEDKGTVRVAGPFTVESLSPHRVLSVDEDDELIDEVAELSAGKPQDFTSMILENLENAGVQQIHKEDKIDFSMLKPWPGELICAEGRYSEGGSGDGIGTERRAAILVGPEFSTVRRADLAHAAREAAEAGFDVVIACAFSYEAHASEFTKLGRIPILKARMNADLHMAGDLKNTGKGNLFVIFGEPDIKILPVEEEGAEGDRIQVKIKGIDVFDPSTGEIRSDDSDGIACWFVDTDYNEESFFVRHAYFLGANDPYRSLKTTLKAEINKEAWASLHSDISRPFGKPMSGRIAVKVINHLGDEVMKVFRVD